MQTSVSLEPSFSYSILYLVIFFTIILIFVLWFLEKSKKEKKVINQIENNNIKNIKSIKLKYLKKLIVLENKIDKNEITIRKAYQNLSSIIRYFVYAVTGIKVQNYTLEDIKGLNISMLYELIK